MNGNNILEKVNGKNLPVLITSVGGIVLAIFLGYILFVVLTNDLSGIKAAIISQTEVQRDTNRVLMENAKVLEANSSVLRILEQRFK